MSEKDDDDFGNLGDAAKGIGELIDGLWNILVWFLRCFVVLVIPFAVYMHKLSKKREEERKQEELRNQLDEERKQLGEERKQFEERRKRTIERGVCHSPFDDSRYS
jgi:hypothetical protein